MNDHNLSALNLDKVTLVCDPDLEERANKLIGGKTKLRNVYTYFRGLFQARLFLGDTQVCIASGSPAKCVRVADAAIYYFWPYRRKPDRHIVETDVNLGLEAARRELRETPAVAEHMQYVEQEMIRCGALDPESKRGPAPRADRTDLMLAWGKLRTVLESVGLTAVEKNQRAYEDAIKQFIAQGGALTNSIDRQLLNT